MTELSPLQTLIVRLTEGGVASPLLRGAIMHSYPELSDDEYLSALLALRDRHRLLAEEVDGEWTFTALPEEGMNEHDLEYSPEFAEMILAEAAGELQELDFDQFARDVEMRIKSLEKNL